MKSIARLVVAFAICMGVVALARTASAAPVQLQYVHGGSASTFVFVHGHGDESTASQVWNYWQDNGATFVNEATQKQASSGAWSQAEAFVIGYDGNSQGFWYAANDVASCIKDLMYATNNSGCNPSRYQRTQFHLVGHSEGGTILDRIFSSGWWPDIVNATIGWPISVQGALGGARSASALYGTDGAGNFCTSVVSWLAGWALKDNGTASLTRGTVIGEAGIGHQGKSPKWFLKVTTTGGSGSCNNNWYDSVGSFINDTALGTLCGCIGYSSDDDADGILWMYDTDPTSNTNGSNGGKYSANYTGYYWHWFNSWANHDHGRSDAYGPKYGYQSSTGCYTQIPGSCVGQYGW
jgi:hypothetical protein